MVLDVLAVDDQVGCMNGMTIVVIGMSGIYVCTSWSTR